MMQVRKLSTKILILLTSLMLLGSARSAAADTITLMWDDNPEPEVAGYIVHVGTQSGAYTQRVDVGNTTAYIFTSAVAGQRYCFALSAYFAGPIEGPKSAEVCGFSNRPPTLVNPGARSTVLSQSTTLQLQGADPDGQAVSYSATGLPSGLSLQGSTGFISGTPTTAGSFNVTATVADGVLTASQSFTWTITAPDATAPSIAITAPTSAATYTTTASTVTLSGSASDNVAVTQVTWANDRGGNGSATGTTSWSAAGIALQTGVNVLTVSARDAAGNTANDMLTVTYSVTVNAAPSLTNPGPRSNPLGQSTTLQLVGNDPNGTPVTYSATGLPPGLTLTPSNGSIAGTALMTGSYPVTATVSDGALTASQPFTWTIVPTASASTGNIRLTWNPNSETSIAGYFVYAGVQTGVYAQKIDVGLTTAYTFANALVGQRYCFAVTAYFAGPVEGPKSTEVCGYANSAPTLASVSDQTSIVGQGLSMQLTGSDPEGAALTYSATGLPTGLAIAAGTGLIWGTPTAAGNFSVTATVSDGALSASRSFNWTVVAAARNTPPVLNAITNQTTEAGKFASLQLSGSDADGDQLTYGANGLPPGLALTVATGLISGTPTTAGTYAVTATVLDGTQSTSQTFTWTITAAAVNRAPTLASVSNITTRVGQTATLQMVGADADGDRLTYTASGLPAGLSINAVTGLISGSPTTPGNYRVTVKVSDGQLSATRSFTWTIKKR